MKPSLFVCLRGCAIACALKKTFAQCKIFLEGTLVTNIFVFRCKYGRFLSFLVIYSHLGNASVKHLLCCILYVKRSESILTFTSFIYMLSFYSTLIAAREDVLHWGVFLNDAFRPITLSWLLDNMRWFALRFCGSSKPAVIIMTSEYIENNRMLHVIRKFAGKNSRKLFAEIDFATTVRWCTHVTSTKLYEWNFKLPCIPRRSQVISIFGRRFWETFQQRESVSRPEGFSINNNLWLRFTEWRIAFKISQANSSWTL